MAGIDVCVTRSIVSAWEPNLRRYSVQYKVTTNDNDDGPEVVLNYMASQNIRLRTTTYAIGNDIDSNAYLIRIGAPRRAGGDKLLTQWLVDAEYEFDLDQRPDLRPVKIEPYYLDATEVIEESIYSGAFNRVNTSWVEKALTDPSYQRGERYPVGNSAKVPILPAPERKVSFPAYRVTWLKKTFLDASFYIDTWNFGQFTLAAFSHIYTRPETAPVIIPKFLKTFEDGTIKLNSVQQPIRTIYGEDWYEVTLEFVTEPIYVWELDRGVSAIAKAGGDDGRGGTYSEGDFPEGAVGQRLLLDPNGQPIQDPVLLDGQGMPLREISQSFPAVYLKWTRGETTSFNQLGIGDWQ